MFGLSRGQPDRWLFAVACLAGAVGAVLANPASQNQIARFAVPPDADYRHLVLFGDAFHAVRTQAADVRSDSQLIEAAIGAMVASLDPYSRYLSAAEFRRLEEENEGSYAGIGIEIEDGGTITSTMPGAPAARAGLTPGAIVERIDGVASASLGHRDLVERLRGAPGSTVRLRVLAPGAHVPADLDLTREWLPLHPVRVRALDTIAYIGLDYFDDFTLGRLFRAIATLRTSIGPDRLTGFVLDLRGNPGGLVVQATAVAGGLLGQGEIVRLIGRAPGHVERIALDRVRGDLIGGLPLVVLVDGDTASAAEIVTGALQDHHRATIIGTRTYGKGAIQTTFTHRAGHGLRLTTAWVVSPAGRLIEGNGITPDRVVLRAVGAEHDGHGALGDPIKGGGSLQDGLVEDARLSPAHDLQLRAGLLQLAASASAGKTGETGRQMIDLPQGVPSRARGD